MGLTRRMESDTNESRPVNTGVIVVVILFVVSFIGLIVGYFVRRWWKNRRAAKGRFHTTWVSSRVDPSAPVPQSGVPAAPSYELQNISPPRNDQRTREEQRWEILNSYRTQPRPMPTQVAPTLANGSDTARGRSVMNSGLPRPPPQSNRIARKPVAPSHNAQQRARVYEQLGPRRPQTTPPSQQQRPEPTPATRQSHDLTLARLTRRPGEHLNPDISSLFTVGDGSDEEAERVWNESRRGWV